MGLPGATGAGAGVSRRPGEAGGAGPGAWGGGGGGAPPPDGGGCGPAAGECPARPDGAVGRGGQLWGGAALLPGAAPASVPGAECRAGPGDEGDVPAAQGRGAPPAGAALGSLARHEPSPCPSPSRRESPRHHDTPTASHSTTV